MFETEKATDANDLPHTFKAVLDGPTGRCACGRVVNHPLHRPQAVEQAAASEPAFVTEKGS